MYSMDLKCQESLAAGNCSSSVLAMEFTEVLLLALNWHVSSSPPSAENMHQWIGSALVQIMACRLFAPKPLLSTQWRPFFQGEMRLELPWQSNDNDAISA